jgi:hypothetical protein
MVSKLKNSLERAKTYLSIVESIERTRQFTREEENWLFQNSRLLDEELKELNFRQLEPAMSDANRTFFRVEHPIATFPNYLKTGFPLDERFIYSALKNNLNGYIQKVEDLISNPKKLKSITKEKKTKILRIIGFNKIKAIELIFVALYITSIILLINKITFIYGFIMNIISVVTIVIVSLLNWEEF